MLPEEIDPIRSVGLIRVSQTTPLKTYQLTYLVNGTQWITRHIVKGILTMKRKRIYESIHPVRK